MTDVKVVAPMNMGKGIVWNEQTKQYEVNLGDGLVFNKQGKIELLPITPKTTFDNGTGQVVNNVTIIDYGNGIIEINGVVDITTQHDGNNILTGEGYVSMEGHATINLHEFNFQKILNVQATAGDQRGTGTAKENAWIVGIASGEPISTDKVDIGAQIVGASNNRIVPVMFQIKGLKA